VTEPGGLELAPAMPAGNGHCVAQFEMRQTGDEGQYIASGDWAGLQLAATGQQSDRQPAEPPGRSS